MKMALIVLLLLLSRAAGAGWTEEGACYVYDGEGERPPRYHLLGIEGESEVPSGAWVSVDVTPSGVPRDAVSAQLSGVMVITHGTVAQTCGYTLYVRRFGARHWHIFGKAVEAKVENGQRINWNFRAPLRDGKFEMWWDQYGQRGWPTGCGFDVAVIVTGYCASK